MYKLDFEEAVEPEIKLPTFGGSQRKQGNSRKTSTSASLTMLKPLIVWITTNCRKFLKNLKRWEYQTSLPVSWETCMPVKKQQLEPDREQQFKIGEEVCQDYILSPCLFNYVRSTSYEILGWLTHKLKARLPGEISTVSDMQMTPP